MVIAVDFDGTIVDNAFPEIGRESPNAIFYLKKLVRDLDHTLILHTVRSRMGLQAALDWCEEQKIPFWGINCNPNQHKWSNSRKVFADLYIDDRSLGIPTIHPEGFNAPVVDWIKVYHMIMYYDPMQRFVSLEDYQTFVRKERAKKEKAQNSTKT